MFQHLSNAGVRIISCLIVIAFAGGSGLGLFGATVNVRLIDRTDHKPTPAMICITALADGSVRLPPDGAALTLPSTTKQFYEGVRFSTEHNWIGPVRKTAGKTKNNNDRGYPYEDRPSIPYWPEPVMYQSTGDFNINLSPGRYRISVYRGTECVPPKDEFDVADGPPITREIQVRRWIDLPKLGWWSGDVHVHHPLLTDDHAGYLLSYAAASDLHMVNLLEMGHHQGTDFKQRGFGRKARVQRGNYCLAAGQEDPRSTFGHIIGLNLTEMVRDLKTYDFYDITFKGIRSQNEAVLGFAHFSWNGCDLPRGFPWYVTTGQIEFLELLQFGLLNRMDYYDYLNLGFRLTAAAGSDTPWGSTIGEVRTYVHTGPQFDADAWFKNLKAGHTFVTNGPAIEFTVDGQLPGSEITKQAGEDVKIAARLLSHAAIGIPMVLALVGNEGVIREVQGDGQKTELKIELTHKVASSQWLVINAACENGTVAHTTPVYVMVSGRPTWSAKRAPLIIQKQLEMIAPIEPEFAGKTDERSKGIIDRLTRAKQFYADLQRRIVSARP